MKDIKKEIERYSSNNYLRKEIIERLQRDGFDIAEINEEMSQQIEAGEDRIVMNMLYFFPSFMYVLLLFLLSIYGVINAKGGMKIGCAVAMIGLVYLGYSYYREKINSFFILSVLMYAGLVFILVACALRIANDFKIPFLNYFTMAFGALYLYFFAKENWIIFKDLKSKK